MAALALAPWLAGFPGCDDKKEEGATEQGEDLTIVVEADKSRIIQEEQQLTQERQTVDAEKDRLTKARQDVAEQLASLSKKDRKNRDKLEEEQRRLEDDDKKLRDRASKFDSERAKLEHDKSQLLEKISSLTRTSKGGMTIEEREALVAQREKGLAAREEEVAKREAKLAGRESQANKTLQDLNDVLAKLAEGGGGKTVIVNQAAPAPAGGGGAANRTQAQKSQRDVRAKMDAKGILMADLPPTAKSQYDQGVQALGNKEFGDAVSNFDSVGQIIDGITVNQSFVQGKMARLNRAISTQQLDDDVRKKVQGLLAEVSDAAADGRFDKANKKANQIALVLKSE